ncbi:MAG: bifunctional diaminohydroxyphosphoribosylaminopyrimidine deaminase/5-amino-6-(5-phosphoribosylamino)uracil reductase RibD [Bacteroidota bacterium]|nr:bifunctional diaminohydroxyphosphoribosylaminopyrimidine deaminase/5-amino-6-(5-phosphoribosylamino)uracil reductase RibD [Bacteroidota bacterium]
MNEQEKYMKRCLELAALGKGNTAPNPMVGSVIVLNDQIIGEGYHRQCGEAHAEVNAIASVKDQSLLVHATLYVSLEPCAHYGKTPPCADLIVNKKIPHVVVGTTDSNKLVAGKGIGKLLQAGCKVDMGILEKECREINRRFFTFQEQKRPYIILKWAQTADGFIDFRCESTEKAARISNELSHTLVHKWRSEEQAIMVGTNTALMDNPQLTTRKWPGKNPIRIVLDRNLRLPASLHLFDQSVPTLVFNEKSNQEQANLTYIQIDFNDNPIDSVLNELYIRNIQSVIIEGGAELLNSLIKAGKWDEARIFTADKYFNQGVKAPVLNAEPDYRDSLGKDLLEVFRNKK